MEKPIWKYTIEFKEQITMFDRQQLLKAQKAYNEHKDEMQLCFEMFIVLCVKIDWAFTTPEQASKFIQGMTDVEAFNDIALAMTEIQTKATEVLEKKKSDENINSVNEPKLAE